MDYMTTICQRGRLSLTRSADFLGDDVSVIDWKRKWIQCMADTRRQSKE